MYMFFAKDHREWRNLHDHFGLPYDQYAPLHGGGLAGQCKFGLLRPEGSHELPRHVQHPHVCFADVMFSELQATMYIYIYVYIYACSLNIYIYIPSLALFRKGYVVASFHAASKALINCCCRHIRNKLLLTAEKGLRRSTSCRLRIHKTVVYVCAQEKARLNI